MSPTARLLCGSLVFISCSAAPLESSLEIAIFLGIVAVWTVICGFPRRRLLQVLRFAGFLFLPLLLLAPIIRVDANLSSWSETIRVPLIIALRGTVCIVVCAATIAAMSLTELGQGLTGLRLPRLLVTLILQIAHQTVMLTDESRRTMAALRVRGVTSATLFARLRSLFALPVLWSQRFLLRAERVSAAMEMRGFEGPPHRKRAAKLSRAECGAVATSIVILGVVLVLRWKIA